MPVILEDFYWNLKIPYFSPMRLLQRKNAEFLNNVKIVQIQNILTLFLLWRQNIKHGYWDNVLYRISIYQQQICRQHKMSDESKQENHVSNNHNCRSG